MSFCKARWHIVYNNTDCVITCTAVGNSEPNMRDLQSWSKDSLLCTTPGSWYNFAVEVIGKTKADITKSKYSGGGVASCLRDMLNIWFDSTTNPDWETIVDALNRMEEYRVIESIEKECLRCV